MAQHADAGPGAVHSSPESAGKRLAKGSQGLKIISQKIASTPANAGQPSANHQR